MRTALLLNNFGLGGAERVASHLINHYAECGKPIFLILLENTIKYDIPSNVNVIILGRSNTLNGLAKLIQLPLQAYNLANILKRENIEYILSMTSRPNYVNIISRLFYRKCNYVISERSYPSQEYIGYSLRSVLNKLFIRNLYKIPNKIICNSEGNRLDLIEKFRLNPDKIRVIYNPIESRYIQEASDDVLFDNNYINFISIGRLDRNKNFQMMIEAFSRVERDDIRLFILGAGVEFNNLVDLVGTKNLQDKVFFTGEVVNPFSYLKSADAFLFSSKSEGFPNVLLEALASGIFIITHNCKSGPDEILFETIVQSEEIIENKFGILSPYGNIDKFTECITRYINNREELKVRKLSEINEKIRRYEKSLIVKEYINYLKA